jgi:hypothetical protein
MSKELNPNPSSEATKFAVKPVPSSVKDGEDAPAGEGVDNVADRLAHKGTKAEKAFDNENGKLFSR